MIIHAVNNKKPAVFFQLLKHLGRNYPGRVMGVNSRDATSEVIALSVFILSNTTIGAISCLTLLNANVYVNQACDQPVNASLILVLTVTSSEPLFSFYSNTLLFYFINTISDLFDVND